MPILQMGKLSTKEVVLAEVTEQSHYWDPDLSAYGRQQPLAPGRLGYLPLGSQEKYTCRLHPPGEGISEDKFS